MLAIVFEDVRAGENVTRPVDRWLSCERSAEREGVARPSDAGVESASRAARCSAGDAMPPLATAMMQSGTLM